MEYEGPQPPYETLESPDAKVYVTWDPKNPLRVRRSPDGRASFVYRIPTVEYSQFRKGTSSSMPAISRIVYAIQSTSLRYYLTCRQGRFTEFEPTISWIRALPHKHKV
jgi:hypothetical protein